MRVVIVGAGISGLALAYRLRQLLPSAEVTVLEKRDRPGGTIWTERQQGFQFETGPNGFLDNKPSTLALCRDLGLADRLLPASEAAEHNRYLFLDARLRRLPNTLRSFLSSDLLSWRGKLSVFLERFRPRRAADSDESIDAFVRRRAGSEAADVLADALVTGIHAGDPKLLSVRAAFPRLAALEAQYGSVLKGMAQMARKRRAEAAARGETYRRTGKMWSFREGLRLAIETLCAHLANKPFLGVAVQRIQRTAGADAQRPIWTVHGEGQDRWQADVVALTCPAPQQAAIVADLDGELAGSIAAIPYSRLVVAALGYRRCDVPVPLDGFGFIAPQRTRRGPPRRAVVFVDLFGSRTGGHGAAAGDGRWLEPTRDRRLGRCPAAPGNPHRAALGDADRGRARLSSLRPLAPCHPPIPCRPSRARRLD